MLLSSNTVSGPKEDNTTASTGKVLPPSVRWKRIYPIDTINILGGDPTGAIQINQAGWDIPNFRFVQGWVSTHEVFSNAWNIGGCVDRSVIH